MGHYALKKRLDGSGVNRKPLPSFIDLSPAIAGQAPECMIELENGNGSKMRITVKGMAFSLDETARGEDLVDVLNQ